MSRVRVGQAERVALVPLWGFAARGQRLPKHRPGVVGFTLVNLADVPGLAGRMFGLTPNGYARRQQRGEGGRICVLFLHRELLGPAAPECVDHINGDKLDNRRVNLRPATQRDNTRNRPKSRRNTSGYKGVTRSRSGRWCAQIGLDGTLHLGTFDDPQDAARAYDQAALKHYGAFASLNFPEQE